MAQYFVPQEAEKMIKKLSEILKRPFRDLSPEEETQFRKWARDNFKSGMTIEITWHPVVKDECLTMMDEFKWIEGKNS